MYIMIAGAVTALICAYLSDKLDGPGRNIVDVIEILALIAFGIGLFSIVK